MNLDLCRRIAVRSPLRGSLSLEELSLSLAVARDPCPLEFFQALRLTKISILDVLPVAFMLEVSDLDVIMMPELYKNP